MNDLSLHGQFRDIDTFRQSIAVMMAIRAEIARHGNTLLCHRRLATSQVTAKAGMRQVLATLPMAPRLALIQWLTTTGPYWEDMQLNGDDDWVEVDGKIVTQTAIGEATICCTRGQVRDLVSFAPSDWTFNPLKAMWRRDNEAVDIVDLLNHWAMESVSRRLERNPARVTSWTKLAHHATRGCQNLRFSENAFAPLEGLAFFPSASDRIRALLRTLDLMKTCFDANGERTAQGHSLYTNHFAGEKAWFSDSSDSEKSEFQSDMTFAHPEKDGAYLFCPWHGKIKTPQLRIHFSWPIKADTPLYILYVGPKITKR